MFLIELELRTTYVLHAGRFSCRCCGLMSYSVSLHVDLLLRQSLRLVLILMQMCRCRR
jgi:hypothetical protein